MDKKIMTKDAIVIVVKIAFLVVSSSFSICFANLPTPPSKPLPNIKTVKNTDTILSEKVQAKIRSNPILKNEPVVAASRNGIITLQGSVKTTKQVRAAIRSAQSVPGVVSVRSQLTIRKIAQ